MSNESALCDLQYTLTQFLSNGLHKSAPSIYISLQFEQLQWKPLKCRFLLDQIREDFDRNGRIFIEIVMC